MGGEQGRRRRRRGGEEADTESDSGGEGALPSSAISALQDDMAQQAVDALNEARGSVVASRQHQQAIEAATAAAAAAANLAVPPPGVGAAADGGGEAAAAAPMTPPANDRKGFGGWLRRVFRSGDRAARRVVDGGGDGRASDMEEGGTVVGEGSEPVHAAAAAVAAPRMVATP